MAFSGLKLETPKPLNVVTKQNVKTTTNQVRHLSQPQHPSQNHSNEAGTEKQPAPLQSSCANLTHSMGSLVTKIQSCRQQHEIYIYAYIILYIYIYIFKSLGGFYPFQWSQHKIREAMTVKKERNINCYETASSKNLSFRKKPLLSLPVTPGARIIHSNLTIQGLLNYQLLQHSSRYEGISIFFHQMTILSHVELELYSFAIVVKECGFVWQLCLIYLVTSSDDKTHNTLC